MRDYEVRLREAASTLKMTDFPTQVVVEVIAGCNLRCRACPSRVLSRRRGEIPVELFRRIVDEISAAAPLDTELYPAYMGEPLMYSHIFEALSYARYRGLKKIYLNTNAMLLDDKACSRLLESGPHRVIASIDGHSAATYAERRVGGDYETVKRNVLNLLDKAGRVKDPPQVWTQMIIDDGNRHEEEAFIAFWTEKGARVKIRPQLAWGNRLGRNYLSDITLERIPCPWLMRQIVFTWEGEAVQCDADHEADRKLGNLKDMTIREIWSKSFHALQARHLAGDFGDSLCVGCHDWKVGKSEVHLPGKLGG